MQEFPACHVWSPKGSFWSQDTVNKSPNSCLQCSFWQTHLFQIHFLCCRWKKTEMRANSRARSAMLLAWVSVRKVQLRSKCLHCLLVPSMVSRSSYQFCLYHFCFFLLVSRPFPNILLLTPINWPFEKWWLLSCLSLIVSLLSHTIGYIKYNL